jgi:hypothetical protein
VHPDPSISLRDVKMDAVPCGWVNAYGKKQRGMNRHISCFGEKTRVSVVSGFKTQIRIRIEQIPKTCKAYPREAWQNKHG